MCRFLLDLKRLIVLFPLPPPPPHHPPPLLWQQKPNSIFRPLVSVITGARVCTSHPPTHLAVFILFPFLSSSSSSSHPLSLFLFLPSSCLHPIPLSLFLFLFIPSPFSLPLPPLQLSSSNPFLSSSSPTH
jgi:hypothetical protein